MPPGFGEAKEPKSCKPTAYPIALFISSLSSLQRTGRTNFRIRGSYRDALSATRYTYTRSEAENRASKPSGAGDIFLTAISGGSIPCRRYESASHGVYRLGSRCPAARPRISSSISQWHTCPDACTPASVRPATIRPIPGCPALSRWSTVLTAVSSSPCTVRWPRCFAHPWKSVPSYAQSIRSLIPHIFPYAPENPGNTAQPGSPGYI